MKTWEKTVRVGSHGPDVELLCMELRRIGYPLEVVSDYPSRDCDLWCVLTAAQEDARIDVDGQAGTQTRKAFAAQATQPLPVPDWTTRAARFDGLLDTLYDQRRRRMIPSYRSSDLMAWKRIEAGAVPASDLAFVVPVACDGSGEHGQTCGHAAWNFTSWSFRAMDPDLGIFPTWRTGRGPDAAPYRNRFLPLLPVSGEMMGGVLHRGLKDYVVAKHRVVDLRDIYDPASGKKIGSSDLYYLQWDPGHVVIVVVARPGRGFIDPRTGLPARLGCYRFAADGSKYSLGQPMSWKRIVGPDAREWTAWEMASLDDDGRPSAGPFRDMPDWPIHLERPSMPYGV